jgi:hypothetical protein
LGTQWFDVLKALVTGLGDRDLPTCPACRTNRVAYLYVGHEVERIGYLLVWCEACRVGIRVSRAKAPADAHFITFEEVATTLAQRVPWFREMPLD